MRGEKAFEEHEKYVPRKKLHTGLTTGGQERQFTSKVSGELGRHTAGRSGTEKSNATPEKIHLSNKSA